MKYLKPDPYQLDLIQVAHVHVKLCSTAATLLDFKILKFGMQQNFILADFKILKFGVQRNFILAMIF
jgi:hypothetical protein